MSTGMCRCVRTESRNIVDQVHPQEAFAGLSSGVYCRVEQPNLQELQSTVLLCLVLCQEQYIVYNYTGNLNNGPLSMGCRVSAESAEVFCGIYK